MQAEWAYQRPYSATCERLTALPRRFLAYYNHHCPQGGIGGATPASRLQTTSLGTTARYRLGAGKPLSLDDYWSAARIGCDFQRNPPVHMNC